TLNSTIEVQMGPANVPVPDGLVGQSLDTVEHLLQNAGLLYEIKDAGVDPTKQANTVTRVDPASGKSVQVGSTVTIYVVNYTHAWPAVTPTQKPTPTPRPTPTPTPIVPTPTPVVTPPPSDTPTPEVTP